jgi:hypothetical protein
MARNSCHKHTNKDMKANELRIGNLLLDNDKIICEVKEIRENYILTNSLDNFKTLVAQIGLYEPIPLTEEWLLKFEFSTTTENSAGKTYSYVRNGIFSSDLSFTYWTTTKEKGKFYRGDLEIKHVHQLQNIYFSLTGEELTVK